MKKVVKEYVSEGAINHFQIDEIKGEIFLCDDTKLKILSSVDFKLLKEHRCIDEPH